MEKETPKGITPRAEDYSRWYQDVISAAELADYSPVRGCMVIRPHGYAIWERLQASLDGMIKETGHENAYFPLFIPESFLKREADHVEGFAPECAVVTHGGGKELEEKLYVRPTSETIIYSMFAQWIQSWRDLPIKINQWANVVRWEMRTRLFLRTTEFLWQEGHTAHATFEEAEEEVRLALDLYRRLATEDLAIPVIPGRKSDAEKFAGALHTYSIEAMMQDGRALQAGTSHHLGQNFAKVFDVKFQDAQGGLQYVWQTSWGVSTRLIGAVIMAHSDDVGLVLPPRIAPIEAVIVATWSKAAEESLVRDALERVRRTLPPSVRIRVDDRDKFHLAWKRFHWERKGVPLRLELGPRDVKANQFFAARRDTGQKFSIPFDRAPEEIPRVLSDIQRGLFDRALRLREENSVRIDDYRTFGEYFAGRGGFASCPWCGDAACEAKVQEETKATIRCLPFEWPSVEPGPCVICGKPAPRRALFAKAY
ncbi:MAG: proline--tRNA ligase [Planctomycetes bacterium]|nr:proline--tRNA ligase [Planctomycetota bacterium]